MSGNFSARARGENFDLLLAKIEHEHELVERVIDQLLAKLRGEISADGDGHRRASGASSCMEDPDDGVQRARAAVNLVSDILGVLDAVEREILPPMRQVGSERSRAAPDCKGAHARIRRVASAMIGVATDDRRAFVARLEELQEAVSAHFFSEENELFPLASEWLSSAPEDETPRDVRRNEGRRNS